MHRAIAGDRPVERAPNAGDRARRHIRCLAVASALAVPPAGHAEPLIGEGRNYLGTFVGQMTDNEWGELFDDWGSVEWRDATFVGANLSREWPVRTWGFVGVEAQAGLWLGEQDHLEFSVPFYIRTPRPRPVFIPALAYGLGLSYATKPSETEIERTGESTELLAHWFFELEFGNNASSWRPYLRIHHRSHAWETFGARTGSNAVLLGIRWSL